MKIAFVGASGYGNVGDDTYPCVFSRHLPEHELLFWNSDVRKPLPTDLGLMVLGGGGIVYNNPDGEDQTVASHHFKKMRLYMEWAISNTIPFGILSCGFQFRRGQDEIFEIALQPWRTYLQQARFITLRSPRCVEIARKLTGRADIQYFPDAGYLLQRPAPDGPPQGNMLTLVPSGPVRPGEEHTERLIRFCRSMQYEVVWLSMGATSDDEPFLTAVREMHPFARIVERPSPEEALQQIASSRLVLTGRYHGMVFARAHRVPFYFPEDVPYKLRQEDLTANPGDAMGHLRTLREALVGLGTSA